MDGLFLVDKPLGMTSFDVVRKIKRAANTKKVGHAGTLDPDATGLLVIAVGAGTRLLRYQEGAGKRYEFSVKFGSATTTDDHTGDVIETGPIDHLSVESIREKLSDFLGLIEQVPPRFSAVHIDGKRAYDLARSDVEFEIKSRQVRIDSFELISFQDGIAEMVVSCGSGTYVRSLARDLGEGLGTCAHTSAIHRSQAGLYSIKEASDLDAIETNAKAHLLPMIELLRDFSKLTLSPSEILEVRQGKRIVAPTECDVDRIALTDSLGELIAVGRLVEREIQPERVLN